MIVSRNFDDKNKLTEFKNYVLTKNFQPSNKLKKVFEKAVDDIAAEYSKELRAEEKMFTDFRKGIDYKFYYDDYEARLYAPGKTRILEYTTVLTDTEKTEFNTVLNGLFNEGNTADKTTFIGDVTGGKFNKKFN